MPKKLKIEKNPEIIFKPLLTPKEMLRLGVFGGYYFEVKTKDVPQEIIKLANSSKTKKKDPKLNYFNVSASQSLSVWQKNGWINKVDPNGWFEWYIKYFYGRRLPKEDERQIKRWYKMRRHVTQVKNNCRAGDTFCRPRQRQALLHWAYDSRNI
ncbi:MAG: hypothetical protein QG566_67 [Patescibacteria group bacterium]|jgi:hypothetical protein|nr:hypothetical protein [Patescibacteria group bacterium]